MTPNEIKNQLKKLAKDFDLKFNWKWFGYLWVSKREEILKEYAGTCPDPIYEKYGKNPKERIKNIDKFVNSKDFKECLKRWGGQVASKKGLKSNDENYRTIKNPKLKKELLNLNQKIKKGLKNNDFLALITKSKIKKEEERVKIHVLRHEWIHILLDENDLGFRKLSKNTYWKYNEGLVTYLENYLDKSLDKLKLKLDKEKYPMQRYYYLYGLKIARMMKDKTNSKERKRVILRLNKK